MATEEFTFPISTDTIRSFIDSPPMWRRVDPMQDDSIFSNEAEQICFSNITLQRKSFSEIEGCIKDHHHHHESIEMDGRDRMDLLWEDFNEELLKNQNSFMYNSSSSSSSSSSDDLGEFGCVPRFATTFNLSNNKKVRVVVMAKALKRLFFLRQQLVKKGSW